MRQVSTDATVPEGKRYDPTAFMAVPAEACREAS